MKKKTTRKTTKNNLYTRVTKLFSQSSFAIMSHSAIAAPFAKSAAFSLPGNSLGSHLSLFLSGLLALGALPFVSSAKGEAFFRRSFAFSPVSDALHFTSQEPGQPPPPEPPAGPSSSSKHPKQKYSHANDFLIRGTIFTDKALSFPGVQLRIRRAGEKKFRWQDYSNSRGEFAIRVPQGSQYELVAHVKGFADQTRTIDAKKGLTEERLVFRMEPQGEKK
jgi:hypothetical protein